MLAILAASIGDEEAQHHALVEEGLDDGEAARAVSLVPVGLARPLLERLGVERFVSTASVQRSDGSWRAFKLGKQPEYVQAVALGRAHLERGVFDHDLYKAIVEATAEVNAASNTLNAGQSLKGATYAVAILNPNLEPHLLR
ncbi:hypothetical protein [Caulobacter mirabilis]|uniref:Uncharacterized protein n=1 Tax=Caulobacter mirabilis TaxID=69666 RepID=A0A2D2B066_9CAUL|nr:hypothetical protein [Caulobacter mirabilis]ATQ43648.1 hypothetical protein CSW64_15225 [Caulobacter mirabilis]